jgi:hypothetical protein
MSTHYFFTEADETEVKFMLENNAKSLYKYGVDNEKPWIVFTDPNPEIEDIQDAMDLLSGI